MSKPKPTGRPIQSPTGEKSEHHSVNLRPSVKQALVAHYGSLSKACNHLYQQLPKTAKK